MKKMTKIILWLTFCLQFAIPANSKTWLPVSKEKRTHVQYTVPDLAVLEINNKYGKVHINTWDKNEVVIDIVVTAKAKTESIAMDILDRINFDIEDNTGSGRGISCRTVIRSSKGNGNNSEMDIDYTVWAPKKNPLDITNMYGDVYVGDFSGKMMMDVQYGALDLQSVTGNDNKIKVSFGSATIKSINKGMLDIAYTNVNIIDADDIKVTNKFGNTDITSVENLQIKQMYGNLWIGRGSRINASVDYANVNVNQVDKSAEFSMKYCGVVSFKSISDQVELFDVNASYSNVNCHFAESSNLSISVKASYSNVKKGISARYVELNQQYGHDPNEAAYEGHIGKAGSHRATIDVSYGNIDFR